MGNQINIEKPWSQITSPMDMYSITLLERACHVYKADVTHSQPVQCEMEIEIHCYPCIFKLLISESDLHIMIKHLHNAQIPMIVFSNYLSPKEIPTVHQCESTTTKVCRYLKKMTSQSHPKSDQPNSLTYCKVSLQYQHPNHIIFLHEFIETVAQSRDNLIQLLNFKGCFWKYGRINFTEILSKTSC